MEHCDEKVVVDDFGAGLGHQYDRRVYKCEEGRAHFDSRMFPGTTDNDAANHFRV